MNVVSHRQKFNTKLRVRHMFCYEGDTKYSARNKVSGNWCITMSFATRIPLSKVASLSVKMQLVLCKNSGTMTIALT